MKLLLAHLFTFELSRTQNQVSFGSKTSIMLSGILLFNQKGTLATNEQFLYGPELIVITRRTAHNACL